MAIDAEQSGSSAGGEQNLEHLLLAADFIDEYPTLSKLVPGDGPGTKGDMVRRIAGLYGEVELLLNDAEAGEGEARCEHFYLSKTQKPPEGEIRGWLTVAVVGTKMSEETIDYRRLLLHRSRWEAMRQHIWGLS